LRVGIDYLPAVSHAPGAGRYTRELVRALVRLEDRPDMALYEVGRARRILEEADLGLPQGDPRVGRLRSRTPRGFLRCLPFPSLRCADLALGEVDLFHHTSRVIPPVARAVQTLAVAEIPPGGSHEESLLTAALVRVKGVLVFSASCAKRVRDRYDVPAQHIHQVAVGCDHFRRDLGKLPERGEIPRILALGALRSDRRYLRLLKAFELLIDRGLAAHLHIVGGSGDAEGDFERVVQSSNVRLRVVRDQSLPQQEVAALLARSSVLVHLVEDAGTPVTPLEAFSLGTPVVASRLPVYEEALGGHAELVVNGEIDHASDLLTDAIVRAIESARDPAACAVRVRHAQRFTWERNARETVAAWRATLREPGSPTSRP
jgi:glycosyltransferase involved in cell wall biosynthesis